jgi:hypothetical protein
VSFSGSRSKLHEHDLITAGQAVLRLAKDLGWSRTKERWLHGVLLGYLEAKVGGMRSEWPVDEGYVDMRRGGPNPGLVELVVRRHGVESSPQPNVPELRKLASRPEGTAKGRFLLILDLYSEKALNVERLKRNYQSKALKGRPPRGGWHPVRIIYLHPRRRAYSFTWPRR